MVASLFALGPGGLGYCCCRCYAGAKGVAAFEASAGRREAVDVLAAVTIPGPRVGWRGRGKSFHWEGDWGDDCDAGRGGLEELLGGRDHWEYDLAFGCGCHGTSGTGGGGGVVFVGCGGLTRSQSHCWRFSVYIPKLGTADGCLDIQTATEFEISGDC